MVVKITVYCTLSILTFWRKCCYFDSILQYSVAPSTGDTHTLQYTEGWTMNCVEILCNATAWSVPAIAAKGSDQHVLYWASFVHLIKIMLFEADWGLWSEHVDLVLKTQQVIGSSNTDLELPFTLLLHQPDKGQTLNLHVSASTYYMDCL